MALPVPYPPTEIAYTDWDTVIAAIEARLGTGAVGDLLMADTMSIKTGIVDDDYFTIEVVDNDTNALVEIVKVLGASDPVISFGSSQEFKFYASGTSLLGALLPSVADTPSLGSATLEWANLYLGDAGGLYFGLAQDIYLERISAGLLGVTTGELRLEGTNKLYFRDSAIYIQSAADGYLDLEADTAIRVNADLVAATADTESLGSATLEFANLYIGTGKLYLYTDQAEYVYSSGSLLILGVGGANEVELSTSSLRPATHDECTLGNTTKGWGDIYLADVGIIYFGDNQDVTLTHVHDAGLLLNAAMQFQFRDAAIHIASLNDGHLDLTADVAIDVNSPILMIVDTYSINAGTTTDDYFALKAFDTGAAMVEVARVAGAADPYFSMGGSQEYKFMYSGTSLLGPLLPSVADTPSLGSATLEWANLYLGDSGGLYFGLAQDIYLERASAGVLTQTTGVFAGNVDAITAVSGAGTAASIATWITNVTTNGDGDLDNVTLANGAAGQVKVINCIAGTFPDTWKITPASMAGGTQITFNTPVGTGAVLIYNATSGWVVTANTGGVIT